MNSASRSFPELISFLDEQAAPSIVMDASYRIVAANKAYAREFGAGREIHGHHCYEVSHRFDVPCDQAGESCPLQMCQENGQSHRVLHLHHTPRGEEHVDVEIAAIRDELGEVAFFVETLRVVRQASSQPTAKGLVGRSPSFGRMLALLMRAAPTNAAILLLGETGTGKELIAHLAHEASQHAGGPFVVVDCSGLTESLFESELFGYEKGAFTGAAQRKIGLVEAANGGTLFLDEVGDIPLAQQVKLLRLLEAGTFRRVGGVDTLRSDFRLVCATHRDIGAMVEEGSFRRDLYFRISTFPILVPALDERSEDIPLLAESLLRRVAGKRRLAFSPEAAAALMRRRYSGNIRELRNLVERASILADGDLILPEHLEMPAASPAPPRPLPPPGVSDAFVIEEPVTLDELESRYLRWLESRHPGRRDALAETLKLGRSTLYRKLKAAGRTRGKPGASGDGS